GGGVWGGRAVQRARRRGMGVGLALLALLSAATPGLAAAAYPAKAIRIVVTYVPGGSTDVVARMLAQHLGEDLGQQIVVDNRGGAGGIIGTEIVAHAPP